MTIAVDGFRYVLLGITYQKKLRKKLHYAATVSINGRRYNYDGVERPTVSTKSPGKNAKFQYCVYFLINC